VSQIIIETEQDARAFKKRLVYSASVIANIRARITTYGECYADNVDFMPMWAGVDEATGNLKDRIRRLAKEMRCDVDWPNNPDEAHFTRHVDLIEVVDMSNIVPIGSC